MIFIIPTNTCFGIWCYINDIESYKKLYEIKWRDFYKPCAIFLDSLETLKNISSLTNEQIKFLEDYKKPWTILIYKSKINDKFILDCISKLPNSEKYKKIWFRIAHNQTQKDLIGKNTYFFLTSANKSWWSEKFSTDELKKEFQNDLENIKILADDDFCINSKQAFSDVFKFVNNNLEIKYFRKN